MFARPGVRGVTTSLQRVSVLYSFIGNPPIIVKTVAVLFTIAVIFRTLTVDCDSLLVVVSLSINTTAKPVATFSRELTLCINRNHICVSHGELCLLYVVFSIIGLPEPNVKRNVLYVRANASFYHLQQYPVRIYLKMLDIKAT